MLVGKPRRGEAKLQESLERLGDNSKIHRKRDLQYSELQEIYQKADLFVLPSEYEGFGLPILEAMLAGIPVITTNKASLPEVGGTHVVYVQENSPEKFSRAILDVITVEQKTRDTKLKNAQVWASSFTWQKSATRTYEVLTGLTKENQISD